MTPEDQAALQAFPGTTRLFPLPNLVLFPGIDQGLHIFEPRYRAMMADTLADNHLMTMVLLKPGWDTDYDGSPAIETVGCLGRVTRWQKLPDGRYDLLLRGLCRCKLTVELEGHGQLYRSTQAVLLQEQLETDKATVHELRQTLEHTVTTCLPVGSAAIEQLRLLFGSPATLGQVCDQISYYFPLPLLVKQALLVECSEVQRARTLIATLDGGNKSRQSFPPPFSFN